MNEIIDAELLQKKKAMPRYNIREVPIEEKEEKLTWWVDKSPTKFAEIEMEITTHELSKTQKRIIEEIARIQREHGLIRREP